MIFNMKKIFICITLFIFLSSIVSAQVIITSQDEQRAKNIVNKMTLKEKIDYISGYTTWSIRPIPRLGLPEIIMSDGPQGIRCWEKVRCIHVAFYPHRHGIVN
jgi:beta-glucosidase